MSAVSILAGVQVGKFYKVPCVRLNFVDDKYGMSRNPAKDRSGWVPVIGPEHEDRGIVGFYPMHYHIDYRFVDSRAMCLVMQFDRTALGLPLSTYSDKYTAKHEFSLRRKLCKRPMPEFPVAKAFWLQALEKAHGHCKLNPALICPHKGIPLSDFVRPDGTVTCPGHGLRWNVKTGMLLPHGEAQS